MARKKSLGEIEVQRARLIDIKSYDGKGESPLGTATG